MKGVYIIYFTIVIGLLFIYHPKLLNFLFLSGSRLPVMKYVENFYLWTRSNYYKPGEIIVGSIKHLEATYFYPRKTYIIVHGFTSSGLDPWIIKLKDELLRKEDCNVFSVNWSSGTVTAGYFVIQERVPDVGEDISKLLIFLEDSSGLQLSQVHLLGHSLGAHIAGFAGKFLNGSLGRITGLDPAGLMFYGASPSKRLDSSDAFFVDVIHTHACYTIMNQWTDCYGNYDILGIADFWPNGGKKQPACLEGGDGERSVKEGSNCHHGMAYVYYIESLSYSLSSKRFLARLCNSWASFLNDNCSCSSEAQYMGHYANYKSNGSFYLNTSATFPYAKEDAKCPSAQYSYTQLLGILLLSFFLVIFLISSLLFWTMGREGTHILQEEIAFKLAKTLSSRR